MDIEYIFKVGEIKYSAIAIFTEKASHPGWWGNGKMNSWGRYIPGTIQVLIFKNKLLGNIKAGDLYTNINLYIDKIYTKDMLKELLQNQIRNEFLTKSRDIKISQLLEIYKDFYEN